MQQRFVLFLFLAFGILMINLLINKPDELPPKKPKQVAAQQKDAKVKKDEKKKQAEQKTAKQEAVKPKTVENKPAVDKSETPEQWYTLGSADSDSPYQMLVTLTNRGAALARIELNSKRYHDLENRSGYLGDLVIVPSTGKNKCVVQVVGRGTPADRAGIKAGDVITALGPKKISNGDALRIALVKTKPNREVEITVLRDGKKKKLTAKLGWHPLKVVRPNEDDPLSCLLTMYKIGDMELELPSEDAQERAADQKQDVTPISPLINKELDGVHMRTANWKVVSADNEHITFSHKLHEQDLEVIKTYRLAKKPQDGKIEANSPAFKRDAYHLEFEIAVRNVSQASQEIAYQLDGPTGLPTEGWWYGSKVSRTWGAVGVRDVVVAFYPSEKITLIGCPTIAEDECGPAWQDESIEYLGVDGRYFSAVVIPQKENSEDLWFAKSMPLRVGPTFNEIPRLTNTSFRAISQTAELAPQKEIRNRFIIFTGPKKMSVLENYGLSELVYFGWFGFVAKPMTVLLHFLHDYICFNYGLAILLLTVLVRLSMYPLSKKQALNAQKMQELQPEIKKLHEKYKKDMEARTKAQQDLFRRHKYNPLSGCLVMFVQLPIFIALYRSLMVDIELRQAPLLGEGIRWCSDLSAPDMFFDWSSFMPAFIVEGTGMLGLGPYFNILPIVTIFLFIVQQKMFMPPPADEQAAMQQKIMKYMMVFMGILFFKVASGLCIYFIASSLWGIAERKLLPKASVKSTSEKPEQRSRPTSQKPLDRAGNGDKKGKRQRRKK